eukprot:scaffold28107_cov51-Isochrysis_galbana.AAC.1
MSMDMFLDVSEDASLDASEDLSLDGSLDASLDGSMDASTAAPPCADSKTGIARPSSSSASACSPWACAALDR